MRAKWKLSFGRLYLTYLVAYGTKLFITIGLNCEFISIRLLLDVITRNIFEYTPAVREFFLDVAPKMKSK